MTPQEWRYARREAYRRARALGNTLAGGLVLSLPFLLIAVWMFTRG